MPVVWRAIARDERVRAFEQLHLPLTASLSHATVIKVGHLVGATEVIVGTLTLEGDNLKVEAHSIRIDVGRLQPDVSERAPLTDLFAIFESARGTARSRCARHRRVRRDPARRLTPSRITSKD